MSTFEFDAEQEVFLRSRLWAALATGRRDGSPQLSHVGYDWDGKDIVVSVKSYTAKWQNARRQPKVALLVHEDRKQLVIYGTAECIDQDPERAELSARVFRRLTGNADMTVNDGFIAMLVEQQRTILRIRPE
ncbi:MAG: TIGR03618 family F420-dependent PPOX class oxidoreductase, partial [Pseudomonadales bacterium]